jgi:hypothetical protein
VAKTASVSLKHWSGGPGGRVLLNSLLSAAAAMRLLGITRSITSTSARTKELCAFVQVKGRDEWSVEQGVEVVRDSDVAKVGLEG